jgi:uncharacterized membrane protein YoaK (UPF0700 family)
MTRKGRRLMKNVASAMSVGSIAGIAVGAYFHLAMWFYMVMGLLLMFGVSFYPETWSEIKQRRDKSEHHHHHHHHGYYDEDIYDEE